MPRIPPSASEHPPTWKFGYPVYLQLVTPRKPRSAWAGSNKARVARLEAEGRMGPRGQQAIEVAKANGSWHVLDDVESLIEPGDLAASLDEVPAARQAWDAFPPSARKQMLFWVVSAEGGHAPAPDRQHRREGLPGRTRQRMRERRNGCVG